MNLSGTQLKDTYGNLLTIGTSAGSPQTGTLQNGDGLDITSLTLAGDITASKNQNATSSFTFQNTDTTGTNVRTHLNATAGNRSVRLEAIHSDYSYLVSNNARLYLQTNSGSNNPLYLDGNNVIFNGQLGIGVTSPATALHIDQPSNNRAGGLYLEIDGSNYGLSAFVNSGGYGVIGSNGTFTTDVITMNLSNGNVGIGTSPSEKLEVQDGSISVGSSTNTSTTNTLLSGYGYILSGTKLGNTSIKSTYNNSNNSASLEFYTDPNGSTPTERMRIDSSGNVGIGTSPNAFSNQTSLTVRGTSVSRIDLQGAGGSGGGAFIGTATETQLGGNFNIPLKLFTSSTAGITFETNSNPRMTIDSSGNVLVGKTTSNYGAEGIELRPTEALITKDGGTALSLQRLTSDGTIISFAQGGGTVGSIGTRGGEITFHQGDTGIRLRGGTDNIIPVDASGAGRSNAIDIGSSSEKFKDLYLGGNVILSSGQGIDFSATADGSGTMTSELLDDYEEGTWTPVIQGSGTAGTYELSTSLAYYTKVGRLVTLHMSLTLDDPITGGGSGYTQITGLPYAKANSFHTTAVVNSIGFDFTGDYLITRFTTQGTTSTVLGIFGSRDDASISTPSISGLSAGDSFTITVSYLT